MKCSIDLLALSRLCDCNPIFSIMPCIFVRIQRFISKIPFRLTSSSAFSSYTLSIDAQFKQSPPIVLKFLSLLHKFSKSLLPFKAIHCQIVINALSNDQLLATKLVKTYSDVGLFSYARQCFDHVSYPPTIVCNAMMGGYLRYECYKETIELFQMMESCNLEIDSYTWNFALKACTCLSDYKVGTGIIESVARKGVAINKFLGSSMISFLVRFGNIIEARRIFEEMHERDVVCWNSMIGGYVQSSFYNRAFDLFSEMRGHGIIPSSTTMASLIQACGEIGITDLGNCVHCCALGFGMADDLIVLTSLVDMYSKTGEVESARGIFDRMQSRNVISWNAMISGYIRNGLVHESFDLFQKLVISGGRPDSATIVSLFQGYAQTANLGCGKILHGYAFRRGHELNVILSTAIVDLYSKCGALKQATIVFDSMKDRNVITWTAMLVGLEQNGLAEDALKLFHQMQEGGVAANGVTLVSLVHSCAHLGSLKKGRSVHAYLMRHGFSFDVVTITALIDMYAKCGKINFAERLYDHGSVFKDVILWNSMITCYGQHGYGHQAVGVFKRMIKEGLMPNASTFVSVLSACSHSGLVEEGISLFHTMERGHSIRPNEKHYACFVDLLSRAGRLEEAEALIKEMPFEPGNAILEALLSGCRTHKNIDVGIRTADRLLRLDSMSTATYITLSNICAGARRWDAVDYVQSLMRKQGLKKPAGYSSIEVGNQVHTFFAGDDSQPNFAEIYQFLESFRLEI